MSSFGEGVKVPKGRISFEEYLTDVGNSKFVVSPKGNGLDCHRTWEAIAFGAIPIVPTSHLDSLYEKLPVIIVKNSWSEITPDLLESLSIPINRNVTTTFPPAPMVLARYWYNEMKHIT